MKFSICLCTVHINAMMMWLLEVVAFYLLNDKFVNLWSVIYTYCSLLQSVELEQLSLYLDSDITPWYVSKPWELLLPSEWAQVWYSTLYHMSYIFII